MANKLKDIFSNHMLEMGGKIQFKDDESSRKFSEALEHLFKTGEPVEVDGITAITMTIRDGDMIYPAEEHNPSGKVVVAPAKIPLQIDIETAAGKKQIVLSKYETTDDIVVENAENSAVHLKLAKAKSAHNMRFSYRMQLKHAKGIKAIAEDLNDALGILKAFLGPLDGQNIREGKDAFAQMVKSFQFTASYFQKLYAVEQKLKIQFDPNKVDAIEKSAEDVYELYRILIERKPIRLNAKLTSTTATHITIVDDKFEEKLGAPLAITFVGKVKYDICGQTICLYTANLLTNAIVKEFKKNDDGSTEVLYGDTDSKPMYISYRGFATKSTARKEIGRIMEQRELYEDAPTAGQYLNDCIAKIR